MASITCSSDQRLSTSKRRLKPLMLRDYLLDDLGSCSSNGFKSFPRRQTHPSSSLSSSSTVRRLLDAEIKRSGLIHHHKPRLTRRSRTTCGTAISHAVHKASTAFLNAVKLLPFHSTVTSRKGDEKQGVFSRSFSKRLLSRSFWRKPVGQSRREVTVVDGDGEIQWWRSAAFFSDEESLDQPSDLISQISTTVVADEATFSISVAAAITTVEFISGDSSSSGSEFFTNSSSSSEVVQSSSSSSSFSSTSCGESEEMSIENDAVEDGNESGESLNAHDCDGSSVNRNSLCNRKECVNEEKEQLSPVSILECPFEDDEEDDAITDLISHQNDIYEKIARKSKRLNGLVRLEPLDLEKRIEKYVERQEEYSYYTVETEEDESENRANRLFALVKSRIGETNNTLASKVADNLLLDYLQEENSGAKEETLIVKTAEDWVMGRQEEICMSWEVREKREVYVKEMKWGCINGDERDNVVEDLANGFFTSLVDEFIFDLAS